MRVELSLAVGSAEEEVRGGVWKSNLSRSCSAAWLHVSSTPHKLQAAEGLELECMESGQ